MPAQDRIRRFNRLIDRKTDPLAKGGLLERNLQKSATASRPPTAAEYLRAAAAETDPDYTAMTFEQGDRVKNQLAEHFRTRGVDVSFDYQGSVTNNTHIRVYSDIDLLVILEDFYHVEPPLTVTTPYRGDAKGLSREVRASAAQRLESSFYEAKVDDSGGKAISISGGSLARKVDVVTCNRVHTQLYELTRDKRYLGINIYERISGERITNFPFLHNALLAERDDATQGRLKALIRIFKSLRNDNELDLAMSSYDICSLIYRMPDSVLAADDWYTLLLRTGKQLLEMRARDSFDDLKVVNGSRPIFSDAATAQADLLVLIAAIVGILEELNEDSQSSGLSL